MYVYFMILKKKIRKQTQKILSSIITITAYNMYIVCSNSCNEIKLNTFLRSYQHRKVFWLYNYMISYYRIVVEPICIDKKNQIFVLIFEWYHANNFNFILYISIISYI